MTDDAPESTHEALPRHDHEPSGQVELTLTTDEVQLLRTALRLLVSTLGREEADELAEVKALIRRLPSA